MRRRAPPSVLPALLLAVALLAAQALGLLHRVAHAPGLAAPPTAAFDGHAHDTPDCRLYDQLAHADVHAGVPALPAMPPAADAPPVPPRSPALARQAAGALARGPPAA